MEWQPIETAPEGVDDWMALPDPPAARARQMREGA